MLIPFLRAELSDDVVAAVSQVFRSGYVGAGVEVERFERAISLYLDADNVICTSSCTGALTLAYNELRIGPESKVLSTPMTCAATNIPLLHLGARIIWLDVDPLIGNVTPATLSAALAEHPDAAAIVIVDWAGIPCDYTGIREVATRYRIPVILDAAQSFGSRYHNKLFPAVGDFICYSFGPTKILSSVEGGCILASWHDSAERLRSTRWYGVNRSKRSSLHFWEYDIELPGHRFVMNDVFAAIGLTMLQKFDSRLALHRRLAQVYRSELDGIPGIYLARTDEESEPNYWMFSVVVERRFDLLRKLHHLGIHGATPHNRNDHLSCFSSRFPPQDLPGTTAFSKRYICLPIGPWVTEEDCVRICSAIRSGW